MCAVSAVGDHYSDKWQQFDLQRIFTYAPNQPTISREEFDALRRDVEEMKALLKRAKEYDERTGQPNCEMEDKVALLRKVAKAVGVDLSNIFTTKE
jgi:hypothetical protein